MSDSDWPDRPSKLQILTGAVVQVLRGERPSLQPPKRSSSLSPPRRSVSPPGRSLAPPGKSLAPPKRSLPPELDSGANRRTWDPEEWEEDQRFINAMDQLQVGHTRDALNSLERLVQDDPGHLSARLQLFRLAIELKHAEHVQQQAEWAIGYYLQHHEMQSACDAYRTARVALPDLDWSEKTLVSLLIAGDKVKDKRVVVDATKLLIHNYPNTPAMPRALLAGAQVQEDEGRPDLACLTLQNLVVRYPLDPLADMARKRLIELEAAGHT